MWKGLVGNKRRYFEGESVEVLGAEEVGEVLFGRVRREERWGWYAVGRFLRTEDCVR